MNMVFQCLTVDKKSLHYMKISIGYCKADLNKSNLAIKNIQTQNIAKYDAKCDAKWKKFKGLQCSRIKYLNHQKNTFKSPHLNLSNYPFRWKIIMTAMKVLTLHLDHFGDTYLFEIPTNESNT